MRCASTTRWRISATTCDDANPAGKPWKSFAKVNALATKDGLTALIFAADFYHLDAVQTLIEAGASVKATDKQEYSAIDYAIIPNKEEVSVPDTEKKIQADRARAVIKYLDSKGAVPSATSGT